MATASFATAILTGLIYFIQLEIDQLRRTDENQFRNDPSVHETEIYDFIIVGGGLAGCVIATRLSKFYSVMLLEAGGEPPTATQVPAFVHAVNLPPDINYHYGSVPQKNANNRSIIESMGKMLGGSGSHNGMAYNRGNANDYDNWAKITRDPSWSYISMLPFFREAETYKGIWPNAGQHGTRGPIVIETSSHPIDPIWALAAKQLGYKVVDPNGPQKEGFNKADFNRLDGRRDSTYNAYLQQFLGRKTLKVIKYATVTKVLFQGNRAHGVEYLKFGLKLQAYVSKEVILSAGSYGSPIVLFRSGIGPRDVLAPTGIPQRKDLPVGRNLQDHAGIVLGPFTVTDTSKLSNVYYNLTESTFEKYLSNQQEFVLSEIPTNSPQAFIISSEAKARGELGWPDVLIFAAGTNFTQVDEVIPSNQFVLAVLVTRPEFSTNSLGTVKLNATAYLQGSTDNVELAEIDYKILESTRDYKTLRSGIETAFKILNTPAFKDIGATYIEDTECKAENPNNWDAYLDCNIQKNLFVDYHAAGTCRMGYGINDRNSVVDSKFRVLGFEGLRVVDASIMPQIPNANLMAPVVAISEKASAEILACYHSQGSFY